MLFSFFIVLFYGFVSLIKVKVYRFSEAGIGKYIYFEGCVCNVNGLVKGKHVSLLLLCVIVSIIYNKLFTNKNREANLTLSI